jgi:hypothetical protein
VLAPSLTLHCKGGGLWPWGGYSGAGGGFCGVAGRVGWVFRRRYLGCEVYLLRWHGRPGRAAFKALESGFSSRRSGGYETSA